MTTIRFIRRSTSIGNAPTAVTIPSEAGEIAGLEKGKYYFFEIKVREAKDLEELEEWQQKKFEVLDEKGRKIQKGKTSPAISKGDDIQPGYTSTMFAVGVVE